MSPKNFPVHHRQDVHGFPALQFWCGVIFNNRLIANCPQNVSAKEF